MSGSQSTDILCVELVEFCHSDSLSENGLREIFQKYGCAPPLNINNDFVDNGFFLLVCKNEKITEGILRYLLEYFPRAAATSVSGLTPLHTILFSNKNVTRGMVQLLIDAYPESITKPNNTGVTPLHILCGNEKIADTVAVDILGLLLERFPEAAQHADNDGYTPLHNIMCIKNATLGMVKLLIDAYPESLCREDDNGYAPLHKLCINKKIDDSAAVDILALLLERCPETARRADGDNNGVLPIHLATMTSKSPEFCRMLIEAYP